MKVLLQKLANGNYYHMDYQWSRDRVEGRNFGTVIEALKFCLHKGFKGVEIVLAFPNPMFDIQLPCCAQVVRLPSRR
jgi:hypothetical protein